MFARLAEASTSLDIGTLFVIATCVTVLLGLFLLFAWMQDRIQALAWWGTAYLIGGFSGALWRLDAVVSPPVPSGLADFLLFIAVGMIWSAARLFHGRPLRWGAMCFGAVVWLAACTVPAFTHYPPARIILSSIIVATYTFLIAAELSRERRKSVHPALAGAFRPDAARRYLSVADGAGEPRHAQPRHGMDRGIRHRGGALCGRRRLHRAGPGQGPHREPLQDGGGDRPIDRAAQPPRLLRGRRGADGGQQNKSRAGQRARIRPRSLQIHQRPFRAQTRRCRVGSIRQGRAKDHARRRRHRPDRRRGIRRHHLGQPGRGLHRRRARAIGISSGRRRAR